MCTLSINVYVNVNSFYCLNLLEEELLLMKSNTGADKYCVVTSESVVFFFPKGLSAISYITTMHTLTYK